MGASLCTPSSKRREALMLEDVKESSEAHVVTKHGSAKDISRINQYNIQKRLGAGAFGAVYSATDHNSEMVAVKVMDKAELRKKSRGIAAPPKGPGGRPGLSRPGLSKGGGGADPSGSTVVSEQLLREIATMKRVAHPNCVRLFEVIDDPLGDRMFLVMEFLDGGECMAEKNLPEDAKCLSEEHAIEVFRDLLDGLEYLHGNGILHRDIKPENMVYLERPDFKLPYSERRLRSRTVDSSLGHGLKEMGSAVNKVGSAIAGTARDVSHLVVHRTPMTEEEAAAAKVQARIRGRLVCVDAHDLDIDASHVKKGFDDTILKATGTPAFYAPEMVVVPAKPFHGRPADVWAAGVTLCMLVSGAMPFWADNMPEVWRKIKEEKPDLPVSCSEELRGLLQAMLAKNPGERPTVAALRQHPWVTKHGANPMAEQEHLPLEITDDDISKAVKRFGNTFTVLKMGKKWKSAAAKSSAAAAQAESTTATEDAAAGGLQVSVSTESVDVDMRPAAASTSSPGRRSGGLGGFGAASRLAKMLVTKSSSSPTPRYTAATD